MLKTKTNVKMLIALGIVLLAVLVFNMNTVNAETEDEEAEAVMVYVVDSTEKSIGYYPPMSGGGMGCFNVEATADNYKNCYYIAYANYNYGDTVKTDLGTFTFKEKREAYTEEDGTIIYSYIYKCPVNPEYIMNINGKDTDIYSKVQNPTTGKEDLFAFEFRFYKQQFGKNANLKIGDVDFIINGKTTKGYIDNGDIFVGFDEITNILSVHNYTGKITYSNMGDTFKIEKDENSNIEVICEDKKEDTKPVINTDTTTNIKLNAEAGIVPSNTVLEVAPISEGTTYNTVKTALTNINKFKVYDINLLSNGTKIQPNGKVKISIPVPTDMNKSNLVVYRVADNGTKTEYKVTTEGDYATFETDHFSMYVLAEKTAETTTTPPSNTDDRKKDDTPKTGTIDVVGTLSIITVISALGIIAFRRKK